MIYLIDMPFGSSSSPNLALGLFRALFRNAGVDCRILNLNLSFARQIGYGGYQNISRFRSGDTQLGEWLFVPSIWDRPFSSFDREFLTNCSNELKNIVNIADPERWLKTIRSTVVPDFLRQSLEQFKLHGAPTVVGFTCSFFQTLPSLAFGRLIKKKYPNVKLVYGGSCFHEEMGDEFIRKIPWIDAVSTGEADDIIVPLFQSLSKGRLLSEFQGILYRDKDNKILPGTPSQPISQEIFESLPDPDFTDFFSNAAEAGWSNNQEWRNNLILYFEGSRGCWWGEKCQCTYCGFNGVGMGYRVKSGERTYETIANFAKHYPACRLQPTDTNMPVEYLDSLLPKLAKSPIRKQIKLLYATRVNISRDQMKIIKKANVVYLHPGIENFSTHLLKRIRKGVCAIQNVFFLKLCRENGIIALWNYLIRIPGERPEDYRLAEELIPKIVHLQPPCRGRTSKIECIRFSPYFFEKGWTENIRPRAWYSLVFPAEHIDISRVAYFFDADWINTLKDDEYQGINSAIMEWSRVWRDEPELPQLVIKNRLEDGSMEIKDTRDKGKPLEWKLGPAEAAVYELTCDPVTVNTVITGLKRGSHSSLSIQQVKIYMNQLLVKRLVMEENNRYLGLALPLEAPQPIISERWIK